MNLPPGLSDWNAHVQALVLGLLTLIQEDVPTFGAAFLAATGSLGFAPAYLGCFLGIWVGDMLLYLAARLGGRKLLDKPWARRRVDPDKLRRSEVWFSKKGPWILVLTRFLPGTRLATYLAAGLLRLPFGPFALITGALAGAWTIGIFLLARQFGPNLAGQGSALHWVELAGWIVAGLLLIGLVPRLAARLPWRRFRTGIEKWLRWEFWPAWLFYPPVAVWCFLLGVRHRSWTLPTIANPGIELGGVVGESKAAILEGLAKAHPEFTAPTHAVHGMSGGERLANARRILNESTLDYPVILKPDLGQRGAGVRLVRDETELAAGLDACAGPWILQRYAPGPREAGVFYYRFPGESRGRIFSITDKVFPHVTGDGRRTLEQLVWDDDRARFMARVYLKRLGSRRRDVPAPGEVVTLVRAGNHAQGCVFRDGWRLWSEALESRIDAISRSLDGFYIGRFDVRYGSEEEFRAGRGFTIIELNGATAESTNIYDSHCGLLRAYNTLFHQWNLVYAIGAANRSAGRNPDPAIDVWRAWRDYARRSACYPCAD